MTTIFLDTYSSRSLFIDERFVEIVYERLMIQSQQVVKLKFIKRFYDKTVCFVI